MSTTQATSINGLNLGTLQQLVGKISADPDQAMTRFGAKTEWKGGTRSQSTIDGWEIGGQRLKKNFKIDVDEPKELCGNNAQPNPQEYLMASLNACMLVGYVAGASVRGIELESVEIEADGEIDLRGFLGLDPSVSPGYDRIHYTVRIKGNGTPEQFQEIHKTVMATSPNRWNLAKPITLDADLVVE